MTSSEADVHVALTFFCMPPGTGKSWMCRQISNTMNDPEFDPDVLCVAHGQDRLSLLLAADAGEERASYKWPCRNDAVFRYFEDMLTAGLESGAKHIRLVIDNCWIQENPNLCKIICHICARFHGNVSVNALLVTTIIPDPGTVEFDEVVRHILSKRTHVTEDSTWSVDEYESRNDETAKEGLEGWLISSNNQQKTAYRRLNGIMPTEWCKCGAPRRDADYKVNWERVQRFLERPMAKKTMLCTLEKHPPLPALVPGGIIQALPGDWGSLRARIMESLHKCAIVDPDLAKELIAIKDFTKGQGALTLSYCPQDGELVYAVKKAGHEASMALKVTGVRMSKLGLSADVEIGPDPSSGNGRMHELVTLSVQLWTDARSPKDNERTCQHLTLAHNSNANSMNRHYDNKPSVPVKQVEFHESIFAKATLNFHEFENKQLLLKDSPKREEAYLKFVAEEQDAIRAKKARTRE